MRKLLLCLISFALVLSACAGAVDNDIPPPEAPQDPITIVDEPQVVPVQEPEPEPELPSLPPEPVSPENWPAYFAALVEVMGWQFAGRWETRTNRQDVTGFRLLDTAMIAGFNLIDVNMDGVPELWVSISPGMGAGPWYLVLSWDFSPAKIGDLTFEEDVIYTGEPLRFFRNDDTGRVIFSSLVGNHAAQSIIYHFADDLTAFRIVTCLFGHHTLQGRTDSGWEMIEQTGTSDTEAFCGCEIWRGRYSPDPTIVRMINLVLEGFTEIPAPPIYTFDDFEYVWSIYETILFNDQIAEIQAWIFEVAESWGGV